MTPNASFVKNTQYHTQAFHKPWEENPHWFTSWSIIPRSNFGLKRPQIAPLYPLIYQSKTQRSVRLYDPILIPHNYRSHSSLYTFDFFEDLCDLFLKLPPFLAFRNWSSNDVPTNPSYSNPVRFPDPTAIRSNLLMTMFI